MQQEVIIEELKLDEIEQALAGMSKLEKLVLRMSDDVSGITLE